MKIEIYPTGEHNSGHWILQWQTESMPAPAFKYYKTEKEAVVAGEQMSLRTK